jgi:hypothetical protein
VFTHSTVAADEHTQTLEQYSGRSIAFAAEQLACPNRVVSL